MLHSCTLDRNMEIVVQNITPPPPNFDLHLSLAFPFFPFAKGENKTDVALQESNLLIYEQLLIKVHKYYNLWSRFLLEKCHVHAHGCTS